MPTKDPLLEKITPLTHPVNIQREAKEIIQRARMQITTLNHVIDDVAKVLIPDFHFMYYRVSTLWECDKSPIGMCLFVLVRHEKDYKGIPERNQVCRYCGGPTERK